MGLTQTDRGELRGGVITTGQGDFRLIQLVGRLISLVLTDYSILSPQFPCQIFMVKGVMSGPRVSSLVFIF